MDISHVGNLDTLDDQRQINRRLTKTLDRLGSGKALNSAKEDPVLWSDLQGLKSAVSRMQAYSENLNRGAASVRIAVNSMEVSDSELKEMAAFLENALVAPEGSGERVGMLEQFNKLHRLLNDSAAPRDLGARKLLDDPSRFSAAGPVKIAAGDNGFEITIRNQQIDTGPNGLDLPEAGEAVPSDPGGQPVIADILNATDGEIRDMMELVSRSRERIAEKSSALSWSATAIEDVSEYNSAFIGRNQDAENSINVPDLEAEAVLAQSLNIRNSLATFGLTKSEETRRLALSLLQ